MPSRSRDERTHHRHCRDPRKNNPGLARAREAAGERDVRLGGGVSTIRQYLQAGLVDVMHLAISPVLLGTGEHLLSGIDLLRLGFRCVEHVSSQKATHVVLART